MVKRLPTWEPLAIQVYCYLRCVQIQSSTADGILRDDSLAFHLHEIRVY